MKASQTTGDPKLFAIECAIEETNGAWVLGHLRFWVNGQAVGNWDDYVDLAGCITWLRQFIADSEDRVSPYWFEEPALDVFRELCDSVMQGNYSPEKADAFRRFNISHLGMSSFDLFDMLLLEDRLLGQRCLWRDSRTREVHEAKLPPRTMQRVSAEFCSQLEQLLRGSKTTLEGGELGKRS
jgi:hypothetical protein